MCHEACSHYGVLAWSTLCSRRLRTRRFEISRSCAPMMPGELECRNGLACAIHGRSEFSDVRPLRYESGCHRGRTTGLRDDADRFLCGRVDPHKRPHAYPVDSTYPNG